MYGSDEKGSADMGKVINTFHCERLKGLIDTSKGKIACGGKVTQQIKYVEPTVIVNPEDSAPVM